jgi:diguanylate cyclase (GGDEF)-like protein
MRRNYKGLNIILAGIFTLLLSIVFATFLTLHQSIYPIVAFSTACALLFIAFFSSQLGITTRYRYLATVVSFVILVVSGIAFPKDLEAIEEMYLFIPLLYLFILPGSLWPIPIAFCLLSAYFPSLTDHSISDWLEDSLELIVITSFATIMTYFQQKSLKQMHHFKIDSFTDYLTGLHNRKNFMRQLEGLLKNYNNNESTGFSLLSLDLDGFKKINDQLGHFAGDQVLKQVAMRLEKMTSSSITAFRTGGDEFSFIVRLDKDQNSRAQAKNYQQQLTDKSMDLAKRILGLSEQAYIASNKHYNISVSIGIAMYPNDANDIESLYCNADLAMYSAKSSGKNRFSLYDKSLMNKAARRYELEDGLKTAIENNELHLLYQPKVCLKSGGIISAEALLRWHHPKFGMVSPMEFIPIA